MAGRAVGSRLGWGAMPPELHAWVGSVLGSPVVAAVDQTGGFSPGCATRVTCADGTRAFVKAVSAGLNPDSPALFRREAQALGLLGRHPLWAGLLASYDGELGGEPDWVVLVLEDVEGAHPDLSDDVVMERLLGSTDELGRVMRERVPVPPRTGSTYADTTAPLYRPGPVDMALVFADWIASCEHVRDLPLDLAPPWLPAAIRDTVPDLAAAGREPMTSVVHYDIRDDNLLQRPDGSIVFLDWGAFGVGPDWLDPLLARLERVDEPWFDASLASSPALAASGDEVVTAWLVAMGTHLAWRAVSHTAVNLPTLNEFRRRESARFLAAAGRRLGV